MYVGTLGAAAAAGAAAKPSPLLQVGSEGASVTEARVLLNNWLRSKSKTELPLVEHWKFDEKMKDAVKDFQRGNNLGVDGKIGENTWPVLRGERAAPRAASSSSSPPIPLAVPIAPVMQTGMDKKKLAIAGGLVAAGILAAFLLTRKRGVRKNPAAGRSTRKRFGTKQRQYDRLRERVTRLGVSPVGMTKAEMQSLLATKGNHAAAARRRRDRVDAKFR